jgi:hypothetical protein
LRPERRTRIRSGKTELPLSNMGAQAGHSIKQSDTKRGFSAAME